MSWKVYTLCKLSFYVHCDVGLGNIILNYSLIFVMMKQYVPYLEGYKRIPDGFLSASIPESFVWFAGIMYGKCKQTVMCLTFLFNNQFFFLLMRMSRSLWAPSWSLGQVMSPLLSRHSNHMYLHRWHREIMLEKSTNNLFSILVNGFMQDGFMVRLGALIHLHLSCFLHNAYGA